MDETRQQIDEAVWDRQFLRSVREGLQYTRRALVRSQKAAEDSEGLLHKLERFDA